MTQPKYIRIKVGNVACDSGLLLLADPANINEYWKKIHPADLDKDKSYMVLSSLKTLEYGKDFINENEEIDSLEGKSIKEAKDDGDIQECMQSEDRSFNLRGAINTAGRIDMQEKDWMLKHPESRLPGIGIVIVPEAGEGLYPVYAIMQEDEDTGNYKCIEIKIEFQ